MLTSALFGLLSLWCFGLGAFVTGRYVFRFARGFVTVPVKPRRARS